MKHRFDVPTLWVGPPGVGKTASIMASYGHVEVLLLSSRVEEDIAGIPWRKGHHEHRTCPDFIRRLRAADKKGLTTCLFLDELDKARPAVADTLLSLIPSRRIGRWALPDRTHIAAACNPPEWGGGNGVSEAMLTRFAVMKYEPNPAEWANWLKEAWPHPISTLVAKGVTSGEVPLFERVGDGLDMRLTCPRTWEYAVKVAIEDNTPQAEARIRGLLTPNAAGFMLRAMNAMSESEARIYDIAAAVAAEAIKNSSEPSTNRRGVRHVKPIGA